ncbi:MAG: aminotransferase class I/II-fold pyridoxal phosphate-dependent enzyme [Epulopiscium sp.]|nr:aminotransferase class I/II-fold pyridoxal phosphate-dependent enzyme [Candidatus Epulonipiscium sp.]
MQAIILAAGMGRRLKKLTEDNTKCMIKVNGVTLIERMLSQLDSLNLNRILIVIGYEGQKLIDYITTLSIRTPIVYIDNPVYDKTNNIYSLSLAKRELCEDDTLLLESDLIFEDSVLSELVKDDRDTLALVDKYESWMDGTCVTLDEYDKIKEFVPSTHFDYKKANEYYKTVNIYKFSKDFSKTHYVPFLIAYQNALGQNEYYEQVLRVIAMLDDPIIKGKRLDGHKWYEIDDIQDLDIAESIFAESLDDKLKRMEERFGGYWRYPKLINFCYLVNPHFPPQKLCNEMKANFERLITQYPSGMRVNSLLAAKNFGVKPEQIVVGNGAAELIKVLMENIEGEIGVIRPTLEEYPNRKDKSTLVVFDTSGFNYSYTTDDIIEFFDDKKISTLVLINPDNPSGNYIKKQEVLRLAMWCESKGALLIADESFVDFADEENATLIDQDVLTRYKDLIVIKSISKSYGVPGIRLGVLASGNEQRIEKIKKRVAIWNINSFGEFYMQIYEKYQKHYLQAMIEFKKIRHKYVEMLKSINELQVLPSQANYIMCKVDKSIHARRLAKILLDEHDILIKDLTSKSGITGNYIRVAVKTHKENEQLVDALKKIFSRKCYGTKIERFEMNASQSPKV